MDDCSHWLLRIAFRGCLVFTFEDCPSGFLSNRLPLVGDALGVMFSFVRKIGLSGFVDVKACLVLAIEWKRFSFGFLSQNMFSFGLYGFGSFDFLLGNLA